MELGINSNWTKDWDSPKCFSNIVRNMGYWKGSSEFTQRYGKLVSNDCESVLNAGIVDVNAGALIKSGLYYVRWSGEGKIQFNHPKDSLWLSPGIHKFRYDNSRYLSVKFKGVRLNSLEIVHEDNVYEYLNGNEWSPEYLAYIRKLGISVVRTMNWLLTSECYEESCEDRITPYDVSYSLGVPIEVLCDLANRLKLDLWYNFPARANTKYIKLICDTLYSNLHESIKLYVELGNEVWNYADPWGDGTSWIEHLDQQSEQAIAMSENNSFILQDHGFKNGDIISSYTPIRYKQSNIKPYWTLVNGTKTKVKVISKDMFQLLYDDEIQSVIPEQKLLLFKRRISPGTNKYYIQKLEAIWEELINVFPRSRMHFTIGTQYNNPWITSERCKYLSSDADPDSIAIAPYYNTKTLSIKSFSEQADDERAVFPFRIKEHSIHGLPIVCYEGGPHYSYFVTIDVENWLYEYWRSRECEQVVTDYKTCLKENGCSLFIYYKDCSTTRFGLTTDISNPNSDGRYRGFLNIGSMMNFNINDKIEIGTDVNPPREDLRPWDGYIESIDNIEVSGCPVKAMVHMYNDDQVYRPMYYAQNGLDPHGREDFNMHNLGESSPPITPPTPPTPPEAEFMVGELVEIGLKGDSPDGSSVPYEGRVICNDMDALHSMEVLVLAKRTGQSHEMVYQFAANGDSLYTILTGAPRPSYKLYHK